jgi:hypothetical protein
VPVLMSAVPVAGVVSELARRDEDEEKVEKGEVEGGAEVPREPVTRALASETASARNAGSCSTNRMIYGRMGGWLGGWLGG